MCIKYKDIKNLIRPLMFALLITSVINAEVIYENESSKKLIDISSDFDIDSIKLTFNIPDVLSANGSYSITGISNNNIENGAPDIPIIEKLVRVKNNGKVSVKINSMKIEKLHGDYPKPYKLPPSQSGLKAPEIFDSSAFEYYENIDPVFLKSIEIVGDYRVARIAYSPVRYNDNGVYEIVTSVDVLITTSDEKSRSDFKRNEDIEDRRFAPFYKDVLNVNSEKLRRQTQNIVPTYCFIGDSETLDAVEDLINWKIQKGLNVIIANTGDIGSNSSSIDSWIESTYQSVNGLMFVLLVGDEDVVASNRMNCPYSNVQAPSDNPYGVIGSGYNPTVHVGRLTTAGKGISTHSYQAWKIVEYESNPEVGPWMENAETWGCSSPNGQPSASYWQNILEGAGMDCNVELEAYGAAKGMSLVGHFDEGLTTYAMKGHGNDQSWYSASIGQTQVSAMNNGMKQPWINNIACLNSRFQYSYYTCFAEAMMTTGSIGDAKGCIGMYSYTISSSGGSPTQGADGMLTAIYEGLFEEDMRHVGVASSYGTKSAGTSGDKKGSMLWGCPEMDIFFKYPLDSINVECVDPIPGAFEVKTDVSEALVSIVTQDFEPLASGYTNASGDVTLDLPNFNKPTFLTITARNCVPIIKEFDVTSLLGETGIKQLTSPKVSLRNNSIQINVGLKGKYDIKIVDLKGRTLLSKKQILNAGMNSISLKDLIKGNQTIIVNIETPENKTYSKALLRL